MKRQILIGLVALLATSTLLSAEQLAYKPGVVFVRFANVGTQPPNKATKNSILNSVLQSSGTPVKQEYALVPGLTKVAIPAGMSVENAVASLKQSSSVLYAEPVYIYQLCAVPNDTRFSELWGMRNVGQTGGTPGADIGATSAWDISTGSKNVIVAVTDTGVDYNHPDLAANMWRNPGEIPGNGIDDDGDGFIDDVYGCDTGDMDGDPMDDALDGGHGTHVAGTIGAVGNNNRGVTGVCWNVSIMAVKIADSNGILYGAVDGIDYAVNHGAKVINASWGGYGYSQALYDSILAARNAGVIFVAAAHNYNSNNDLNPLYPASFNLANIIAVMATNDTDSRAVYSNYGLTSVDIGAPGGGGYGDSGDILSTYLGGGYALMAGTSMASPHVAGACALLLSIKPTLTYADVKELLLTTTDPVLPGLCVSGGRMNLAAAAQEAATDTTPPSTAAWDIEPKATGFHTVSMRAKMATDISGVEYYFECVNDITINSGWEPNTLYTFAALSPSTTYGFHFMVRDKSPQQNQTGWSDTKYTTTAPVNDDNQTPAPDPARWAVKPRMMRLNPPSIRMKAFGVDESGVQYQFKWWDNDGTGSIHYVNWQDSDTATVTTLLQVGHVYKFQCETRDKSARRNLGPYSEIATVALVAGPRILAVPAQYENIQSAIDAAVDGDIVEVSPWPIYPYTYRSLGDFGNRNITFEGKAITVRSIDPENPAVVAATVIDCEGVRDPNHQRRAFIFDNSEGPDSILAGFTIRNGYILGALGRDGTTQQVDAGNGGNAFGGAIMCIGSNPTIRSCVIENCIVESGSGGTGANGANFTPGVPGVPDDPNDENDIPIPPTPAIDAEDGGNGGWSGLAFGGGIYCDSYSGPLIEKCVIRNCQALAGDGNNGGNGGNGGVDPVTGDTFFGRNGGFGGSVGLVAGGGIFSDMLSGGALISATEIIGCTITGCDANNSGIPGQGGIGGIPGGIGGIPGLNPYIDPFDGVYDTALGGGIYYGTGNSAVNISSTTISQNHTEQIFGINAPGGGIIIDTYGSATVTMSDCTITGNYPNGDGGGILFWTGFGPQLVLRNCDLTLNNAGIRGGGLCVYPVGSSVIDIYDSNVVGNNADYGGGLLLDDVALTLQNSSLRDNDACEGGAITSYSGSVNISNVQITGNSANANIGLGGGLALWNIEGDIIDSNISGNIADGFGGAAFITGWTTTPVHFKNCLISDNSAVSEGGGLSCNVSGWARLDNCTVANNVVIDGDSGSGGGIMSTEQYAWVEINNSILWGNSAANGTQIAIGSPLGPYCDGTDRAKADVDVNYSDVEGGESGVYLMDPTYDCTALWWLSRNIDVNPRFVLDYYLSWIEAGQDINSPCVDAGSADVNDPDIDLAAYTTRTDGVADTGIVDLGYHHSAHAAGIPPQYRTQYALTIEVFDAGFGGYGRLNAKPLPQNDTQFDISDPNTILVNQGTIVNLTAIPELNFRVQSWSGTDDDTLTDLQNTVFMDSDKKIVVTFEPDGLYFLTVKVIGNGTVQPVGRSLRTPGEVVMLTATPSNSSDAIIWTGTDNDGSGDRHNTVTMTGHKDVTVEFYTPRILYVGAEPNYPTIQLAINDANPHDIVMITPGTYNIYEASEDNPFLLITKDIRLTSMNPSNPGATTIIGGFIIQNVSRHMVIEGLTIRDARYWKDYEVGTIIGEQNPFMEWHWATPQGTGIDGYGGGTCRGGGMELYGDASPTVRNCQFINCVARGIHGANGAGGISDPLTGGDGYSGNGGPGGKAFGGAVYCGRDGSPSFENCSFIGCTAQAGDAGNGGDAAPAAGGHGGAWGDNDAPWWNEWKELYGIYHPLEEYWKYSGYGGAVYCDVNSTAQFLNCTFSDNNTIGSSCGISGSRIPSGWPSQHYKIQSYGGAIYVASQSSSLFADCVFNGNEANMQGPPVSRKDNVATVNAYPNVSFGGAVSFEEDAKPVFERCSFTNNRATIGGGSYIAWAQGTIADCNFVNNLAYQGGGVMIVGGTNLIKGGRFTGNQSTISAAQGGAITLLGANAEIVDCNISFNQTLGLGGGIYVSSKNIDGLEVDGDDTVLIKNCLVTHNSATLGGGGISANWYSEPNIMNCTIADNNSVGGSGGGLYCSYNNFTTIINSIIWRNSAISGSEIAVGVPGFPSVVNISYSDVNQATGAIAVDGGSALHFNGGIIGANPLFTGSGNYYLSQTAAGQAQQSPCVDAGSDFASRFGLHRYTTRTDNAPDTGIVDMGYHYPLPSTTGCMLLDFVKDGKINFADFALFASFWLDEGCSDADGWCLGRDVTYDGTIDVYDLMDFSLCWLFGIQTGDTTPPEPNPMQWASPPAPVTETSVSMIAATATDDSGEPVQYQFERTVDGTNVTDTAWQASTAFTDMGLLPGSQYCYKVRARDESGNVTDWSDEVCVANVGDTNAPSPAPTIVFNPGVHIVVFDVCDLSGEFQFPYQYPDYDMTWWHKVVVNVAGIVDDSNGPVEIRFICSSNSLSSQSRIPLAYRPILVGQGVQNTIGTKADGWRLTYNGDTIIYDVKTATVGGIGVTHTWTVCAYDGALNSACSASHVIGP